MILQSRITNLLNRSLFEVYEIKAKENESVYIAKETDSFHFFSNIAFKLSKELKKRPLEIAKKIKESLDKNKNIKVEIGGPGFLNFTLKDREINQVLNLKLRDIVKDNGKKLCYLEYVSANPTGPLHLGHLRIGLASKLYGNLLEFQGIEVYKDYLLNDGGNQINTLLFTISKILFLKNIDKSELPYFSSVLESLVKDLKKQKNLFSRLEEAKESLLNDEVGEFSLDLVKEYIVSFFRKKASKDMQFIGINVKTLNFTSEKDLITKELQNKVVDEILKKNIGEWKDNAFWLKTKKMGDEKNRVLIKSNGDRTYVFTDIIYHLHKYEKFKNRKMEIVNFWGSDQYGNESTLVKGLKLLGKDTSQLSVIFMQLIQLKKDNKVIRMSKRTGDIINISDLPKLLSVDSMIHYILSKSLDTTLALDIDSISKQDKNNPMYYLQYTYARITQLLNRAAKEGYKPLVDEIGTLSLKEKKLTIHALDTQRIIQEITKTKELHKIYQHLMSLCEIYHSYYQNEQILSQKNSKKQIEHKLYLNRFIQSIIKDLFSILDIKSLEFMEK